MANNTIVARGGVEFVPPISLAFGDGLLYLLYCFFFFNEINKNKDQLKKESLRLFFLGSMGCGICGAFPFIAD